jgi:hypothetical protein
MDLVPSPLPAAPADLLGTKGTRNYALVLAGLAAVGFVARRRDNRSKKA